MASVYENIWILERVAKKSHCEGDVWVKICYLKPLTWEHIKHVQEQQRGGKLKWSKVGRERVKVMRLDSKGHWRPL